MVELPGIVPQKTLLSINRDGSIRLYLACWKSKEGRTLSQQQLTARSNFFNKLESMFGPGWDDLQTRPFPTGSPDRWLPKFNELVELIKQLATCSHDVGSG